MTSGCRARPKSMHGTPASFRLLVRLVVVACAVVPSTNMAAQDTEAASTLAERQLLMTHAFAILDSTLATREARARTRADPRLESAFLGTFDAFATGDTAVRSPLDAWVAEEPRSAYARAARASNALRMAGASWENGVQETVDEEAVRATQRWLALARADIAAADRLGGGSVMAPALSLEAAMVSHLPAQGDKVMGRIVALWPESLLLRMRYVELLGVRYGGTDSAQRDYVARSQVGRPGDAHARLLPAVLELERGLALADSERYRDAVASYDRALAVIDHWSFREARAIAYLNLDRYGDALADLSRAIAMRPGHASLYAWRAVVRKHLGERARLIARIGYDRGAMDDLRTAARLDPTEPKLLMITGDDVQSVFSVMSYLWP